MNIYTSLLIRESQNEHIRLLSEQWVDAWTAAGFQPMMMLATPKKTNACSICPCDFLSAFATVIPDDGQFHLLCSPRVFPRPHFKIPDTGKPTAFSFEDAGILMLNKRSAIDAAFRSLSMHANGGCRVRKASARMIIGPGPNGKKWMDVRPVMSRFKQDLGWRYTPLVHFDCTDGIEMPLYKCVPHMLDNTEIYN